MKFAALDTETDAQHRITCAAIRPDDPDTDSVVLYSQEADGTPCPRMRRNDLRGVLGILEALVDRGFTIVSWNGLGADFKWLDEGAQSRRRCRKLALQHVDIMFQFHCLFGFPIGLEAACRAMSIVAKLGGYPSSRMPELWEAGEHDIVMAHCTSDAVATLSAAKWVAANQQVAWVTRAGKQSVRQLPEGLLTVEQCLALPPPDVSWIVSSGGTPVPRTAFCDWLNLKPPAKDGRERTATDGQKTTDRLAKAG